MGRLKELRKYVNKELNKMEDPDERISAVAHLYGVSLAATMLAKARGLNEELAAMAAMLHDLYAYKSGSYDDHAHKGAELAREILNELKITDECETIIICSAIYHHDDKLTVDGPMDELIKDADVIHHTMNDSSKDIKEKEQARYDSIIDELGLKPIYYDDFESFDEDYPMETIYYRVEGIDKNTEESKCGYITVCQLILCEITSLPPGLTSEEYVEKARGIDNPDIPVLFELMGILGDMYVPDEYEVDKDNRICLCNDDYFGFAYPFFCKLDSLTQKYTRLKLGYLEFCLDNDEKLYEDDEQLVITKEIYLKHKSELDYMYFEE
ncbi:MAG: HD domain-containing protein [Eubacterium sp.]|nr:HD domain-containing protein [Eubacterium sp.]